MPQPPSSFSPSPAPAAPRIADLANDLRPREELRRLGAATHMSAESLVAILLRSGLPGQNVVELARQLIQRAHGLVGLSKMSYTEIQGLQLPGVGPVKAMELEAAFEIGRRAVTRDTAEAPHIATPEDAYDLIAPLVRDATQEHFYVCVMDVRNHLIGQPVCIATGANDRCPVRPAEALKPAVTRGGASVVFAHNHPSGNPTPSAEDLRLTARLIEAGTVLGIRVNDHVVVGRLTDAHPAWISLRREHLADFP